MADSDTEYFRRDQKNGELPLILAKNVLTLSILSEQEENEPSSRAYPLTEIKLMISGLNYTHY